MVWLWLGARRRLCGLDLLGDGIDIPEGMTVAFGEPGRGVGGWRLTHRQAAVALRVALRGRRKVVGYGDVSVLASILQDDVLEASLRERYLAPLEAQADGGAALRATLRAYIAAERNAASAAAALNVSRRTVSSRLRAVEQLLGSTFGAVASDLEAALQLDELERHRAGARDRLQ
jgi:sugar diacid utilization regulator